MSQQTSLADEDADRYETEFERNNRETFNAVVRPESEIPENAVTFTGPQPLPDPDPETPGDSGGFTKALSLPVTLETMCITCE